ncbi:putative 1-phosphatidylinositol 4-kinase [Helianthus annuus]|nr:putative 1-phosphatidylinositol 4-kinase [Helianthus annuus]
MMGSNSSSQSSPVSVSNVAGSSSSSGGVDEVNSRAIVVNGVVMLGGVMGTPNGSDRRGVGVAYFEDESVENLEKQEIAFKLISHIVDKSKIDPNLLERVHVITKDQLKSVSSFLKKPPKLVFYSVWRKLRVCEDLFSSLLDGIAKIAVTREGHLLRVLFIRFKPLVQATCAQVYIFLLIWADTWASSQGAMFESVLKSSCEIIKYGWTKDPHAVDTFIKGLAANIRQHNDYEEEIVENVSFVAKLESFDPFS